MSCLSVITQLLGIPDSDFMLFTIIHGNTVLFFVHSNGFFFLVKALLIVFKYITDQMFGAVWGHFFFFYFFKEISYALQSYIFDKKTAILGNITIKKTKHFKM